LATADNSPTRTHVNPVDINSNCNSTLDMLTLVWGTSMSNTTERLITESKVVYLIRHRERIISERVEAVAPSALLFLHPYHAKRRWPASSTHALACKLLRDYDYQAALCVHLALERLPSPTGCCWNWFTADAFPWRRRRPR